MTLKQISRFIWDAYNIPAFLFHELCHVAALFVLCPWVTYVDFSKSYFYMHIKNKELDFGCQITWRTCSSIVAMLVSAAPVIGWLIVHIYLCFTFHNSIAHFILWIYFIFGANMSFMMSIRDKKEFKTHWDLLFNKQASAKDTACGEAKHYDNNPKGQEPEPKTEEQ